eukprot:CAMPEP_0178940216 /NCGR_PEP_ID=MMETSP0789-20121207/676_1 /TAXON_ID=3005 /ORGANISM="Rhizosolenia setigera, Strain CCMP 1694" /LENGTH=525 /DNA_ID=CAMNT_0020619211 /DNA_START=183 /DNA_END=1761 /DNA_ORIENTATION=-
MVLLVLPLECERISSTMGAAEFKEEDKATASLYLGLFVFLAGLTQLICPIVGKLSDESPVVVVKYSPGRKGDLQDYIWGKRLPYIVLKIKLSLVLFGFSLTIFMIGMNTIYSSMIALVPDLIPDSQVGQANGILALQMVVGSLSGFAAFYWLDSFHMNNHLNDDDIIGELVYDMYFVYIVVLCLTTLTTLVFTREKPQGPDKQERENIIEEAKTEPSKDKESPEYSSIIFGLLYVWKVSLKSISHLKMEDILTTYKITPEQHGDFFYATISRALYYMGISVQTFFLYYVHDILRNHSSRARKDPQSLVSFFSTITQIAGGFTCLPVGQLSDSSLFGGQRIPFVNLSCALLCSCTFLLTFCTYVYQVEIICVLLGAANGAYLTMETSLAVDALETLKRDFHGDQNDLLLEDDNATDGNAIGGENDGCSDKGVAGEDEAGKDSIGAAQLLGIWGVAGFVGVAAGPVIGGPLLYIFGKRDHSIVNEYNDDNLGGQVYYSLSGYAVLFTLSALYFLFSSYVLRWIKYCK